MTPAAIMEQAKADGVRITRTSADTLKVSGAEAAVTRWAPVLREHKADLLSALAAPAEPLLEALVQATIGLTIKPIDVLAALAPEDVAEHQAGKLPPESLRAFAVALVTQQQVEAGIIPPSWTSTTTCRQCGPVPIWPGHSDETASCRWCANRRAGRPIPRTTTVTCSTCIHFERDPDHPHLGTCNAGEPMPAAAGFWDTDRRDCSRWIPTEPRP